MLVVVVIGLIKTLILALFSFCNDIEGVVWNSSRQACVLSPSEEQLRWAVSICFINGIIIPGWSLICRLFFNTILTRANLNQRV